MVTTSEYEKAKEVIEQFEKQQKHIVRDDILNDCPSQDYNPGKASGECETDGHYMCMECIHCDPKLTPFVFEDLHEGLEFLNYDDVEKRWNEVKVICFSPHLIDVENIDHDSEHCENVWSIRMGEFTNINNSRKL